MAIKTELNSIPPITDLEGVIRQVNDHFNLVMQAIYDIDRRVDALAEQVAALGSTEPIGDDKPEAD